MGKGAYKQRGAMGGEMQNKASHKGERNIKGGGGSNKVSDIEHVGSSGDHGVRFAMPKESDLCDHSNVRGAKVLEE